MIDLRKAAEMALEALSEYTNVVTSGTDPTKWDEVVDGGGPAREAIQALRQALAQQEQEPVAWIDTKEPRSDEAFRFQQTEHHTQPLYTAPPKREWVGLTDKELNDAMGYWSDKERSAYGGASSADNEYFDVKESWRYIEAKLKEKNFGSAD